MTDPDLAMLKEEHRIPELWRLLNLPGTPGKSTHSPFRKDLKPSFSVYAGGLRWHDFATGEDGDAIDFFARARGLPLPEAIAEFKRLVGVVQPRPAAPVVIQPRAVEVPFDWEACVAAFTTEQRNQLAAARGYPPELVEWLHAKELVGVFEREHVAFPVHKNGAVVGCHYRKPDATWRYNPIGTATQPLVIGDVTNAKIAYAFESQWDAFAFMACMGWHLEPCPDAAVIATRGATNAKLLTDLCRPDATVYAFSQNDGPGKKWLMEAAQHCGCKCLSVVTPDPHKDLNDWIKAGAGSGELRSGMQAACLISVPVLLNSASRRLPVIVPDDEESESAPAPFPVDALPPAMAVFVETAARSQRVPAALPGACALGVISAAIGGGVEVVSGPNRTTRANLFLLASAESGSGKSETFRIMAAPLFHYQSRRLEIWKQKELPQLQSELLVLEKEVTILQRKAARAAGDAERNELLVKLESKLARKGELAALTRTPCIIAQDVTTERLAVLLFENEEVMCSLSGDARKVVDNIMGRYNPGQNTDESLYLHAYSGDPVKVDRQGRAPVMLKCPCLTLCWFVQPDLLLKILEEQSLSASGFIPRLLICNTEAVPRKITGEESGIPDAATAAWEALISKLLDTYHAARKPFRVEPSPAALACLNQYHNAIVDRRTGELADVGSFAARWAENAWRLSAVFHVGLHGPEAHNHQLELETAQQAIRLMEWFAVAQLNILAKSRRKADYDVEAQVLTLLDKRMERQHVDYITARDVYRDRIVNSPPAAHALLERMERQRVITKAEIVPEQGGKTMIVYRKIRNPVRE